MVIMRKKISSYSYALESYAHFPFVQLVHQSSSTASPTKPPLFTYFSRGGGLCAKRPKIQNIGERDRLLLRRGIWRKGGQTSLGRRGKTVLGELQQI